MDRFTALVNYLPASSQRNIIFIWHLPRPLALHSVLGCLTMKIIPLLQNTQWPAESSQNRIWRQEANVVTAISVSYLYLDIFICISITQSTDEPRLLACILQQIYSSFQGWFLSISTFGTGNTKVWFFSMEILLRTWNETFPWCTVAQIPGDPNLEIFEHKSCWARLHLISCRSEMLEWLWWAVKSSMGGYSSKN